MRNLNVACAFAALAVVSCSNSTNGPAQIDEIPIPNNPKSFVFDISYADQGRYYIADRTNKSVDAFETGHDGLIAVITGTGDKAFHGVDASGSPDKSGPNGVVGIPGKNIVYVGDVASVKVVDTSSNTVTMNIPVPNPALGGPSPYRADEGCYDPDDNLVMFAHPADLDATVNGNPAPIATWISTTSNTIVAQFQYLGDPNEAGLEQCAYDSGTKSFYLNNDGTTANPEGQVDVFTAASVKAGTPIQISKSYPLGKCNPAGLALGPGTDMMVTCVPDPGLPIKSLILNRTNGATVASVAVGGADQIAYDSVSNRYFLSMRYWVDTGISNGPVNTTATPANPALGIVDAATHLVVAKLPAGNNAHSLAVDGPNHKVYVPHNAGKGAFASPGISVYSSQ